ncbi:MULTISPECIES: signal peptidase I [unclassified Nocardioides]|uniref:signal peptidase I n=1 Tax=unclassified Nocardioides TaxID=2615069 RepID=UPI003014DA4B
MSTAPARCRDGLMSGRSSVDVHDDEGATPDPAPAAVAEPKRRLSLWQETVVLLGAALVLSFIVKTLFLQAFYIPSGSMEPGLEINDRILVQKVSYWGGGSPERGDIVVFEDPGGWLGPGEDVGPTSPVSKALGKIGLYPTGGHLVKRVIGVAGDVIECCDDQGRLMVNGTPIESDFTLNDMDCDGPMVTDCESDWSTGPVPDGELFVMGDHRDASADSSEHMCRKDETDCVPGNEFVPTDLVVGKVFARVWPAKRFSILHKPDTFADLD